MANAVVVGKLRIYKMREIAEVSKVLSSGIIAVLAAVNTADDYFKIIDKLEM